MTMQKPSRPRPVVLCVLDGWGCRGERADNAILAAKTPHWHRFLETAPHAQLQASELYVGLPAGQMGNSEVGHTNLGAGRVVLQDLPRIDQAIEDGSLARSPVLAEFIAALKASGGTAHLLGLLSPGGVHSHQHHLAALARLLDAAGIPVRVHAFLDGRDTPPKSAAEYLARFAADTATLKGVALATLSGRYYAMDRDQRWDRVEKAYQVLTAGEGERATDAAAALRQAYDAGKSDEFVPPTAIGDYAGMRDGDGLLSANFRADRMREMLEALLDPGFAGFPRPRITTFAAALGMAEYSTALNRFIKTLFPPEELHDTFGEVVSRAGLTQLRIAETEKYAHVTFFFNGGQEVEFPGESRILVPSPKVATYDLQPEMSAPEVTDKLVAAIDEGALRRHRGQLRQYRHGRPYRRHRRRGVGGRGGRSLPWPARRGGDPRRRHAADHRRSRQRRDDARPRHRPAAHRPHPQPGAAAAGQPARRRHRPQRRPTRRRRADPAAAAGAAPAPGHDRQAAAAPRRRACLGLRP